MAAAIALAGGEVRDDRFVLRPGVFLANQPQSEQPSSPMRAVASLWGVPEDASQVMTLAESSAIITYMNPESRSATGSEYVETVLARGHHSIMGQSFVTLGLFGIPLEIVIELLSHGMDTTARQTSSAIKAMDDPLFCVYGPDPEPAITLLNAVLETHQRCGWTPNPSPPQRELRNCHWPSSRAVILLMGMRLIDWSKLLAKRSPRQGNEAILRYLCGQIATTLREVEDFRHIIKDPDDYGWESNPWH